MKTTLFHDTSCQLGEGPLWAGNRLFYFDIEGHVFHSVDANAGDHQSWDMGCYASAAGKLKDGKLLIATENALEIFDPLNGDRTHVIDLESDNPNTRSNDGRADRQGGFWIGTMGKTAQEGAGAIYRYYKGELRLLFPNITITNAICFAPDGKTGYFADSRKKQVYAVKLDGEGWPVGEPTEYFSPPEHVPDGAIVDNEGALIIALWGGSGAIRVNTDGQITHRFEIDAPNVTCPAFGADGKLFFTTAKAGMSAQDLEAHPNAGGIFSVDAPVDGIEEPFVLL